MTQSSCSTCRYNGDRLCAVNPTYWNVDRLLNSGKLSKDEEAATRACLQPCGEWEAEKTVNMSIDLTEDEWRHIATGQSMDLRIWKKLKQQAIEAGYGKVENEVIQAVSEGIAQIAQGSFRQPLRMIETQAFTLDLSSASHMQSAIQELGDAEMRRRAKWREACVASVMPGNLDGVGMVGWMRRNDYRFVIWHDMRVEVFGRQIGDEFREIDRFYVNDGLLEQ